MAVASPEKIEEARALRAAGLSWRKVAARLGVSLQTPRVWLLPKVRDQIANRQKRRRKTRPDEQVTRRIRRHAAAQALEEGVDRAVVYERWGVPYRTRNVASCDRPRG